MSNFNTAKQKYADSLFNELGFYCTHGKVMYANEIDFTITYQDKDINHLANKVVFDSKTMGYKLVRPTHNKTKFSDLKEPIKMFCEAMEWDYE